MANIEEKVEEQYKSLLDSLDMLDKLNLTDKELEAVSQIWVTQGIGQ